MWHFNFNYRFNEKLIHFVNSFVSGKILWLIGINILLVLRTHFPRFSFRFPFGHLIEHENKRKNK